MPIRQIVSTDNAPAAIGAYSQAVKHAGTLYISGQIPLDPNTQEIVSGDARAQIVQVFRNLLAVAEAAGASSDHIVKLMVYLVDLGNFPIVNEVMGEFFNEPYPARAAVGVASLPKTLELKWKLSWLSLNRWSRSRILILKKTRSRYFRESGQNLHRP